MQTIEELQARIDEITAYTYGIAAFNPQLSRMDWDIVDIPYDLFKTFTDALPIIMGQKRKAFAITDNRLACYVNAVHDKANICIFSVPVKITHSYAVENIT